MQYKEYLLIYLRTRMDMRSQMGISMLQVKKHGTVTFQVRHLVRHEHHGHHGYHVHHVHVKCVYTIHTVFYI